MRMLNNALLTLMPFILCFVIALGGVYLFDLSFCAAFPIAVGIVAVNAVLIAIGDSKCGDQ
ncbi:hypothetical protein [Solilutibacter pythonis]|uniref:hypothetical protein n=1 Tax=Solilutibacter pythonis TaxID=2483112 RepID=UPI0013149A5B|nr:hypothetical protein [Lysobacter pythonis]